MLLQEPVALCVHVALELLHLMGAVAVVEMLLVATGLQGHPPIRRETLEVVQDSIIREGMD
jgi:hypothetical protein